MAAWVLALIVTMAPEPPMALVPEAVATPPKLIACTFSLAVTSTSPVAVITA